MMQTSTREWRFTGWHMAAVMVLFFGTVITVNLTLAFYANQTWSGLVVKNSYVASQKFPELQRQARAQAALGWTAETAYRDGRLIFTLNGRDGAAVAARVVTVKLMRPASEVDDRTVTMEPLGDGRHGAEMVLAPGQWRLDFTADAGLERPYRYIGRLFVRPDGSAR